MRNMAKEFERDSDTIFVPGCLLKNENDNLGNSTKVDGHLTSCKDIRKDKHGEKPVNNIWESEWNNMGMKNHCRPTAVSQRPLQEGIILSQNRIQIEKWKVNKPVTNRSQTGANKSRTEADESQTLVNENLTGSNKNQTVANQTGANKNQTVANKDQTGANINQTDTNKIQIGTNKSQTDVKKSQTDVKKSQTEAIDSQSFVCHECGKKFAGIKSLKTHKRQQHILKQESRREKTIREESYERIIVANKKKFVCKICTKSFRQRVKLEHHMQTHDKEKDGFACQLCNKIFQHQGHWKRHEKFKCSRLALTDNPSHLDITCPGLDNTKELAPHWADDQHSSYSNTSPDITTTNFNVKKTMKHSKQADKKMLKLGTKKEKPTKHKQADKLLKRSKVKQSQDKEKDSVSSKSCPVCGQTFARSANVRLHMRLHRGEKPFSCSVCGKTFRRTDHLKNHQRVHSKPKAHQCDLCEETFKRKDHLKYHQINSHGAKIYINELRTYSRSMDNMEADKNKTILCDVCGLSFANDRNLKNHLRIHSNQGKFSCKFCGKSFNQSSNLNIHLRKHTGETPYKCLSCDQSFTTSAKLKTHARKHTGDLPFTCQVCFRLFGESHLLKMHMRIHNNQRPYSCTHCSKTFTHSSTLRAHVRTHTGAKPYKCDQCNHAFAQISSLTYHKRTHSGEKPYSCHICGNSYTRMATLNIHLTRHTGQKRISCPQCDYKCDTSKHLRKHVTKQHSDMKESIDLLLKQRPIRDRDALYAETMANNFDQVSKPQTLVNDNTDIKIKFPNQTQENSGHYINEQTPHQCQVSEPVFLPLIYPNGTTLPSNISKSTDRMNTFNMYVTPGTSCITNSEPSPATDPSTTIQFYGYMMGCPARSRPDESTHGLTTSGSTLDPVTEKPTMILTSHLPNTTTNQSSLNSSKFYYSTTDSVLQATPYISHQLPNFPQAATSQSSTVDQKFMRNVHFSTSMAAAAAPSQLPPVLNTTHPQTHSSVLISGRPHENSTNLLQPSTHQTQSDGILLDYGMCGLSQFNSTNNLTSSQISFNTGSTAGISTLPLLEATSRPTVEDEIIDNSGNSQQFTIKNPDQVGDVSYDLPVDSNIPTRGKTSWKDKQIHIRQEAKGEAIDNLRDNVIDEVTDDVVDEVTDDVGDEATESREQENSIDSSLVKKEEKTRNKEKGECEESDVTDDVGEDSSFSQSSDSCQFPSEKSLHIRTLRSNTKITEKTVVSKKKIIPRKKTAEKIETKLKKKSTKFKLLVEEKSKESTTNNHYIKKTRAKRTKGPVECNICGQKFSRTGNLTTHMRLHSGERPYVCNVCDKRYTRSDHLKSHMMLHKGENSLLCNHCGDVLNSIDQLTSHIAQKHEGKNPFSCNCCNFSCIHLGELKDHVRGHDDSDSFSCTICHLPFVKAKDLKKHMESHDGLSPFSCPTCLKSFNQSSCLKLHVMTKHTGEKHFKCGVCQETFVTAAKLQRHMRTHNGSRPFACEFCGKMFIDTCLLKMHVRIHTNDKPFKCKQCHQCFTHRSTLRAHVRIHTGTKPYTCEICGDSFAQVSSLTYHRRSHEGLKPYTCHICGSSYTRSTTLNIHLTRHTGQKRVSCPHCSFRCDTPKHLRKHMAKDHSQYLTMKNELLHNEQQQQYQESVLGAEQQDQVELSVKDNNCVVLQDQNEQHQRPQQQQIVFLSEISGQLHQTQFPVTHSIEEPQQTQLKPHVIQQSQQHQLLAQRQQHQGQQLLEMKPHLVQHIQQHQQYILGTGFKILDGI